MQGDFGPNRLKLDDSNSNPVDVLPESEKCRAHFQQSWPNVSRTRPKAA